MVGGFPNKKEQNAHILLQKRNLLPYAGSKYSFNVKKYAVRTACRKARTLFVLAVQSGSHISPRKMPPSTCMVVPVI